MVLGLHITHDRFGGTSDLNVNGHLHYPNDIDRSLNETVTDKIPKYRMTIIITHLTLLHLFLILLVRLGGYIVNLCDFYSYRTIGKLTDFFAVSGVPFAHSTSGLFHFRHLGTSSQVKSGVDNILAKVPALRITLNLDGTPITSKSHTHPSH